VLYRGVILKTNKDYAIVATQESDLIRIKSKDGMEIGQKIYFFQEDIFLENPNQSIKSGLPKWISAVAAVLIMALITSIYVPYVTNSVYAVVSLDINPSVELMIDKNYKVIKAEAETEESAVVISGEIRGKFLNEAVVEVLTNAAKEGYSISGKNTVLISTAALKEKTEIEKIEKLLSDGIREIVDTESNYNDIKVVYIPANNDDVKQAEKLDISVGKYKLYELSNKTIDVGTIETTRVSDLIEDADMVNYLNDADDIRVMDGLFFKRLNRIDNRIIKLETEILDSIENLNETDKVEANKKIDELNNLRNELTDELEELVRMEEEYDRVFDDLSNDPDYELEIDNEFDDYVSDFDDDMGEINNYYEIESMYFEAKILEAEGNFEEANELWEEIEELLDDVDLNDYYIEDDEFDEYDELDELDEYDELDELDELDEFDEDDKLDEFVENDEFDELDDLYEDDSYDDSYEDDSYDDSYEDDSYDDSY